MSVNFSDVKVLIVGDVMLDRYCWGSVNRISPEAPVPVVNLDRTEVTLGGAANVAANVVGLGAKALLVGVVGKDSEAELFPKILREKGISHDYLVAIENRPTTVKTRIVAHNQHIVRIDQETAIPLTSEEENRVWNKISQIFNDANIVIISDYAKGLLTDNLISRLITLGNEQNKPVLVDPKGKDYAKYRGATLLTPNKREAFQATSFENVEKAGHRLMQNLELKGLLITLGEEGMSLFESSDKAFKLNALARKVYDVTGAGDTVIATLSVAMASGYNLREAANLANIAAGFVVEKVGTTAIDIKELREAL
jgi:rfaE bifunctional protein kinase chain/domain